ncbi:hypothetical protein FEDK69T_09730 [Flavobacterium enshiense DK69]|nr:hypothetical protein FEDK69T_09730 [Flavobacterium enshiense DK69]
MIKSTDQTRAKTQLGGVKPGFIKFEYQTSILLPIMSFEK